MPPAASRPHVHVVALTWVVAALLVMVSLPAAADEVEAYGGGEQDLLTLVNQARSQAGSAHLVVSSDLATNARRHAVKMATSDRSYHQSDFSAICCWNSIAENVYEARGVDTRSGSAVRQVVDRAHRRLMESSTHRANILGRDFHDVGIGVAVNHATGTVWVAQVFRQRTDGPPRPAPTRPDPSPAPQSEPEPPSAAPSEPAAPAAPSEPAVPTEPDGRALAAHEPQRHDLMIDDPRMAHDPQRLDRSFGDPVAAAAVRAPAPIPDAEPATRAMTGVAAGAVLGWWSLAMAIAGAAAVALFRRR